MRDGRAFALALLLGLMTGLKIMLPDFGPACRERLELLLGRQDYTELIRTMGRNLHASGIKAELRQALKYACGEESREAALLEPGPELSAPVTAVPELTEPESPPESPEPEENPAVAAFLQRMEEFPGYELPDNVRSDMPELPFEYASPVLGCSSSGFGYRMHPIYNEIRFHYGSDFAAGEGETVRAFAAGYVYAAGECEGYGNYLILTHQGGFSTLYAHLSEFSVTEGEMVELGAPIGLVGSSGRCTGPHLHFELLLNDVYLNPEYYI